MTVTDDTGAPVSELSYTEASHELDRIVAFFEQREVDVDQLVERLERATAIVDELDRRLRRTRAQVEQLVPRLEAAAGLVEATEREGDTEPATDEWGEIIELNEEVDEERVADLEDAPSEGPEGDDEPPGLF
jgi:exodeoxyribonuclease VII small subunit